MFNNHQYFQSISTTPLLIASDLERGAGQQMKGATLFPSNMAIASKGDPYNDYLLGKITAEEAKELGIHIIFAPVLDVNNNPKNPIIDRRSFGSDPMNVYSKGYAYMRGLQDNNIVACGKHFPGHGDTNTDSHISLPVIYHDRSRLDSIELVPFKRLIKPNDVAKC